jgi:3D (Asp-Asp-Asp) domain-containing protein
MQIQFALLGWRMFQMVKRICTGLCLLLVFFMQQKEVTTAELQVAECPPATVVTETKTVNKPTKTMTVVATAYCSCKSCCGVYAENRPNGVVYTASGSVAQANHTIAVDTSVIPFGTHIIYNGTEYVAEDTGGAIKGNRIDIYFDSHEDALKFGRRTIEIEVIV